MYGGKRRALLAVAWVTLTGCGAAAPQPDWTTVRDTLPSGTVRVTNVPLAEVSPTWTLVEELRVGTVEGAGPDAFAYLKGLVVLEDGRFAVLDSQAQELAGLRPRRRSRRDPRPQGAGTRRVRGRERSHARPARPPLGPGCPQRADVGLRSRGRLRRVLPVRRCELQLALERRNRSGERHVFGHRGGGTGGFFASMT